MNTQKKWRGIIREETIKVRKAAKAWKCDALPGYLLEECGKVIHPGDDYLFIRKPGDYAYPVEHHYCMECASRKGLLKEAQPACA